MNKITAHNSLWLLISILPLSLLLGSGVINTSVVIIDFVFIYILLKQKKNFFSNNLILYILLLFWISLIINLLFSSNFSNSFLRVFGFVRFVIFVLAIKFCLEEFSQRILKKIYLIWSIIFLAVSLDLIFELTFGFNTLGNYSYMPGRLSSFLGEELKIGNWYIAFGLIIASFMYYNFKEKYFFYSILISTIFISLVIGERANFIKYFLISSIFFILYENKLFLRKVFFTTMTIILLSGIIFTSNTYKERFWYMFLNQFTQGSSITTIINLSPYGGHWHAAWEIFLDHKIFGVGINNYRIVSGDNKYYNEKVPFSKGRQNIHPHQLYLEILSETGIFGLVTFFLFIIGSAYAGIRNYLETKNLLILSGLLFVLTSTLLPLPSGSFFTTYGATIFWINYSFMISKKN